MAVSNLTKEIFEAKIDVLQSGSSITGFPVTFNISSMNINFDPVFWDSESDVALSGAKRSNIRGWDMVVTLDYNTSLQPQKIKDIMDQLPNAINTNDYEFRFYPNADISDYIEVIPTSNNSYNISWRDTVRKGGSDSITPKMEFTSRNYRDTIDAFFQT